MQSPRGRRVRVWCWTCKEVLVEFSMMLVKPTLNAVLKRGKALLKSQNRRNRGTVAKVKWASQCINQRQR